MNPVRFGVIGVGTAGTGYAADIGGLDTAECVAVCRRDRAALHAVARETGAAPYDDWRALCESSDVDAVLVATPHPLHVEMGVYALERGKHLLMEKPLAPSLSEAQQLVEAAVARPSQVFGIIFQKRTSPTWRTVRRVLQEGEIGSLRRVRWTMTRWYRTQAYYDEREWRGTWRGEGGGLLLNQLPHDLDLLTWLVGMPNSVRASVGLGRDHRISTEDDVTAMLAWPDGVTGVLHANTGEVPGEDRLVLVGDRGTLTVTDGERVSLSRLEAPLSEHLASAPGGFDRPGHGVEEVPVPANEPAGHAALIDDFARAVQTEEEPLAPAHEGLRSLELANAMLLSGLEDRTVTLPLDTAPYDALLARLRAQEG